MNILFLSKKKSIIFSYEGGTSVQYIEKHYAHMDMKKMLLNAQKSYRVDKDGLIERYSRSND